MRSPFRLIPVFAVAATLSFAGCSREKVPIGFRIAVIPENTTEPFWVKVHEGASKAEKDLEEAGLDVDILWKGPLRGKDVDYQSQLIERFVSDRVSGIVLAPLDRDSLTGALEITSTAKIPVVLIHSVTSSENYVASIRTDEAKAGAMAGEKLAAALKEQPGTVAFWPMTETSPAAAAYESGVRASLEGLENVTLVPSTSEPEAGGLLALLKKLDAIVCLTEEATVEVIEACEESDSSVKIIGRGGNPKAVDALRNDDIEGLLIQNPFQMGYLGVVAIVGQLTGKPLDRNTDSGSFLVTRDSLLHQSVPTGGVIAP